MEDDALVGTSASTPHTIRGWTSQHGTGHECAGAAPIQHCGRVGTSEARGRAGTDTNTDNTAYTDAYVFASAPAVPHIRPLPFLPSRHGLQGCKRQQWRAPDSKGQSEI